MIRRLLLRQHGTGAALPGPFSAGDFRLVPGGARGQVTANAVVLKSTQGFQTDLERVPVRVVDGYAELEAGYALVAVVARDGSSRTVGVVKDFGLRAGAVASTFAHDSHNLLVVGCDPGRWRWRPTPCARSAAGSPLVAGGDVIAQMRLPVFGLLSDAPLAEIVSDFEVLETALR